MKIHFHLFDLPTDLYIELQPSYRKKVFNKALKKYGSWINFSKSLKEDVKNVRRWKSGVRSFSIRILKKMAGLRLLDEKEVEKKIIKLKKCGGHINNPKLPIVFDENLARIIAAAFCDGGIGSDYIVHYTNKDQNMRASFQKAIRNVFGDVKLVNINERHKGIIQLNYSGVMGNILNNVFGVPRKNKIFLDTPIPKLIINANNAIVKTFIRQCFDDEGWVSKSVRMSRTLEENALKSKEGPLFLQQLKYLLEARFGISVKGPRLNKKREYFVKNKKIKVLDFELAICDRKSLEIFYSNIGFDIDYKMKKLKKCLDSYMLWQSLQNDSLKFFLRECAKFVLERDKPFSSQLIAFKTKRSKARVSWAINELNKKGFITSVDYGINGIDRRYNHTFYTLTEKGLNTIFNFV